MESVKVTPISDTIMKPVEGREKRGKSGVA
jgi:hypothetical protein